MYMKIRDVAECIIYTPDGGILLQKKTEDYPVLPGGYWCLFGGVIEPGEKPEQTIKRELFEELGIEIDNFSLFLKRDFSLSDGIKGKDYIFKVLFSRDISDIKLSEGAGFAIFTEREFSSVKIAPTNKKPIQDFFKENKKE